MRYVLCTKNGFPMQKKKKRIGSDQMSDKLSDRSMTINRTGQALRSLLLSVGKKNLKREMMRKGREQKCRYHNRNDHDDSDGVIGVIGFQ